MSKITLDDLTTAYSSRDKLNENFQAIEDELNDKVLYRDNPAGEDNSMQSNLDMNSKRVLNLPSPVNDNEPARWADVKDGVTGIEEPVPSQSGNAGEALTTNGSSLVFGKIHELLDTADDIETTSVNSSVNQIHTSGPTTGLHAPAIYVPYKISGVRQTGAAGQHPTYGYGVMYDAAGDGWVLSGDAVDAQFGVAETGTDKSAECTDAISFASDFKRKLIFSSGDITISSGVVFAASDLSVEFVGDTKFTPDSSSLLTPVIIGSTSVPARMSITGLRVDRGTYDGSTENIGVLWMESVQSTFIDIESRYSKYNQKFAPTSSGFGYNEVHNLQSVGGAYNRWIEPSGTGWVNENNFYGGRNFATANTQKNTYINSTSSATPNNNIFYKSSDEGTSIPIAIHIEEGDGNNFYWPRTEGATRDVVFGSGAQYNHVESSRFDLYVEDYSEFSNNTWNTRAGDKQEAGGNDVIGMHRLYTGAHTTQPTSTGISISGITQTDPCVITATSHGLSDGDHFYILSVSGMTELNGNPYRVANSTVNTFELQDIYGNDVDSTDFSAYTSGGAVIPGVPANLFVDDFTSSGYSHGLDIVSGRDGADHRSLRGLRKSDGLERWHISTGGHLMVAQQIYNQQSSWSFEPLRLGNYRIWVDSTGDLRINNGAPSSDTDGTVVGTQS